MAATQQIAGAVEVVSSSPWQQAWRRLRRNTGALVGLVILVILVLIAILAPLLTPYDPIKQTLTDAFQSPNAHHWLGTDMFGRDILTRLMYGARISLKVGYVSVGIAAVGGLVLGLLAGYFRGMIDMVIMGFCDLLLAFPGILLALAIVTTLGPSLLNLMIAVGISTLPTYIRLVRATTMSVVQNVYVEAAIASGARNFRVLTRHVLPNILGPVIVLSTLGVASAILWGAALNFLGLGAQPPSPEWGAMLSEGRNYMLKAWWMAAFPGLAIMFSVLGINLLGDGLRDALDPKMKL